MKKILVTILLAFFGVINVNAQEIDSLQIKSDTISIESLAARLDKLQHDYDFLYCCYELDKIHNQLNDIIHDIIIETNNIMSACYNHPTADIDFYIASKELYNSNKESFSIRKIDATTKKSFISLKMSLLNFTETETRILDSSLAMLEKKLSYIDKRFDSYKNVIDIYKEK